jgi:hypothetical protein
VARGCVALACALSVACGVNVSARAEEPSCADELAAVHDATAHGKWLARWNQGNIGAWQRKAPPSRSSCDETKQTSHGRRRAASRSSVLIPT